MISTDFSLVPRYCDGPILTIPKYVYENCNQVTCNNYSDGKLAELKKKAISYTKQRLDADFAELPQLERTARGEELDWVYGLSALEKELLPAGCHLVQVLTIDSVIHFNGLFSRMDNSNPGEFRIRTIHWPKYTMADLNESTVMYALHQTLVKQLGPAKAGIKLREISDPKGKRPILLYPRTAIENILKTNLEIAARGELQYVDERGKAHYEANKHTITPAVVKTWIEQQGRTDDKLDIARWLGERVHYFPMPQDVPRQLHSSLEAIKDTRMHPIAKAAKIWFDIVDLHISHEANKRTGKAIGSVILLSFGYLPPKIGPEDEKEYIGTLQQGMEDPQGLEKFTQFIIKMMIKTHKEHAGTRII